MIVKRSVTERGASMSSRLSIFVMCLFLAGAGPAGGDKAASADGAAVPRQTGGPTVMLKVPLFSKNFSQVPVALVNDEPITLEEFTQVLSLTHEGREGSKQTGKKDYEKILNRLITTNLIIQEARSMGMDELPEVKDNVDVYSKTTLRDLVRQQLVKEVTADKDEVEKYYQDSIKEYKLRSLMFKTEADAHKVVAAVAAGKPFDEVADQALTADTARGSREPEIVTAAELNPAVARAVAGLKAGDLSKPVPINPGFVIFRLEEVRNVEDPEARKKAQDAVLTRTQTKALVEHNKRLSKKYLKFNTKLINSLDFGAKEPGMEKLMKDKRVLVEVKGEKPVTVGDLATAFEDKLYHGSARVNTKKLNAKIPQALEEIVGKRLILSEALRLGLDRTDEYRNKVREYERSVLFAMFVQRIILPAAQPKDEELTAYYDQHLAEYALPPQVRFEGLAFAARNNAEDALDKARRGTEMRWLKENAPGQVAAQDQGVLQLGENLVPVNELPEAINKALADAHAGDVRLVAGADNNYYVLSVHETMPSRTMPFEQAQEEIGRKVYEEKLQKGLDGWADKLKASSEVTINLITSDK